MMIFSVYFKESIFIVQKLALKPTKVYHFNFPIKAMVKNWEFEGNVKYRKSFCGLEIPFYRVLFLYRKPRYSLMGPRVLHKILLLSIQVLHLVPNYNFFHISRTTPYTE